MSNVIDIRDRLRGPFTGPAVWHGPDLADRDEWVLRLSSRQTTELRTALTTARPRGTTLPRAAAADFPLPALAGELERAAEDLASGRGWVLIKGVPVRELSEADAGAVLRAIGQYLGWPVPQDPHGHALRHVRDTGGTAPGATATGYRTRARVPFHTDESDLLGLLCLRPACSDAVTSLVSSAAVHNALADLRPDLVQRLYRNHFFDRRDQHAPGERPYLAAPLATRYGAALSMRYDRDRLEAARSLTGVPRPEPADTELYDLVDSLADSPRLRLDLHLEAGDLLLVDNHSVMHARPEFEDFDDPERGRHLLPLRLARHRDTDPPGTAAVRGPRAKAMRREIASRDVIRPRSLHATRPGHESRDRRPHRGDG
ncbi:TauD/TfdA family dioxygenase [Streptomyces sp. NPDC059456]|uniref:TauD/TfdA family dioxygenase n=1 Tax=Streptomyces sp. NPDC059456 TaxID=3346838 RepID=UPI00369DFE7F